MRRLAIVAALVVAPASAFAQAEKAQCEKIFAKAWAAVGPNLAKLSPKQDAAALEKWYASALPNTVTRCAELTTEKRACLEKAANPIAAIHTCDVNMGIDAPKRLFPPSLSRDQTKLFATTPLTPEDATKKMASAAGTWVNDWPEAKTVETWVIAADGTVKQTRVAFGKTEEKTFKLKLETTDRVKIEWTPQSSQQFVWLHDGKKLWANGNLLYDAYAIADAKKFAVMAGTDDFVFFNNGKCEVVTGTGLTAPVTCKLDGKAFKFKYQIEGKKLLGNGKPDGVDKTYTRAAGHLLRDELVSAGEYDKK